MEKTEIIAHRGASAYAPENTLAAFTKAKELGASMLEFDLMLSADEKLFIFHDEHLRRTSNGKGKFNLQDSAYIESLDAGSWFSPIHAEETIPRFTDMLTWLAENDMQANIELKPAPGQSLKLTRHFLKALNEQWPKDKAWPLVSSFDEKALNHCRDLAPELPLGLLLHVWDKDWLDKAKNLRCYSIHTNHKVLSQDKVSEIKQEGYKLFAYTVNSKRQTQRLFAWGVDAIFSDYPDLLS